MYRINKRVEDNIYKILPSKYASIISAMILGNKDNIDEEIYSLYKYLGISHILAISGLHIAIISFIILFLLNILNKNKKINYTLCIVFLIFYTIMTAIITKSNSKTQFQYIVFNLILFSYVYI